MENLVVYCADIGSIGSRRFAWARAESIHGPVSRSSDIRLVVESLVADLTAGKPVALGFECPLFVPIAAEPFELGCARPGEGDRSWSAGAGASVLATGLVQAVWILREVRLRIRATPAFLDWKAFHQGGGGSLFVWEAFVSSSAKGHSHAEDAEIAVRAFLTSLPDLNAANAVACKTEIYSLAGAAILRTGWSDDVELLKQPCVVIKAGAKGGRKEPTVDK